LNHTRCPASGTWVSLSAVEADAKEIDCRACGRTLSVKPQTGRLLRSWREATVPRHAPLRAVDENPTQKAVWA
jgi:hypothetical protein